MPPKKQAQGLLRCLKPRKSSLVRARPSRSLLRASWSVSEQDRLQVVSLHAGPKRIIQFGVIRRARLPTGRRPTGYARCIPARQETGPPGGALQIGIQFPNSLEPLLGRPSRSFPSVSIETNPPPGQNTAPCVDALRGATMFLRRKVHLLGAATIKVCVPAWARTCLCCSSPLGLSIKTVVRSSRERSV